MGGRTRIAAFAIALLAPIAAADEELADCEPGQGWIGYRSTDEARSFIEGADLPARVHPCEGEHWDGQDPVSGASPDDTIASEALSVGGDDNERYVALRVMPVATTAIDAGACMGGDAGLEGDASCNGVHQARVALYWRDNTPGNLVMTGVAALGVFRNHAREADCTQEEYEPSAIPEDTCGRDNTAITLEVLLP